MIPLVMSIIATTETFQRDMARARGHVGKFSQSVKKSSITMTGFSKSILRLAGVGGGLYLISGMLKKGVRDAAEFERQMAMVSTMLDDQSMSIMPRYEQQLRDMSRQFGEGTETLSKGLYDILSASIAPKKALEVLTVSVKAAKAGMADAGIAADAVTTILNSYSLNASRAGDVSDKLFAIVKRGKTTFAELAPNIGKVAALASTAGLSFDDLGATLATMTRSGVQTEIAITSLRAVLLSFLKPQKESIELAREFGVELNSNTLRTIGLTGVIQKLRKATAEELAVIVPTSRAITGFAAAIQNAESMANDYEFMLNSLGRTEEAYQKVIDTSAHKLDQLEQEWKDLGRAMGELAVDTRILDFLRKVNEALSESVERIKTLPEFYEKLGYVLRTGKRWTPMAEFGGGAGGGRFGGYGTTGGWGEPIGETRRAIEAPGGTQGIPGFVGPLPPTKEERVTQDKAIYDAARSYVRMYDSIDSKSKESFEWRKKLIEAEYKVYAQKVEDTVLLADLEKERMEKLAIEQAKTTGSLVEGFGAGIAQLQRDMQTIGELGFDLAQTFGTGLVDSLNDALWKARDFDEAMRNLGQTMAQMATKWLIQQAVFGAMGGIGGIFGIMPAAVGHKGGRVGSLSERRWVSPDVFNEAPRYHGLKPGESAVIAQDDEVISRPGGNSVVSRLDKLIGIMQERQTINATILDKRDVVTGERISGREGEGWVIDHIRKNQ